MKRLGIFTIVVILSSAVSLFAAGDMIINGNLGIGVADPTQRLEITGGHAVLNANRLVLLSHDDISYYYITGAAWNTGLEYHYYSGHRFFTDTDTVNPKVVIDQAGKVGIGTATPDSPLEVRNDNTGNTITDGLVLKNAGTATSSVRQYAPALNLSGHGWNGSADQLVEWRIVNDPTTWDNPTLRFYLRRGAGDWEQVQCMDSAAQFENPVRFAAYDARETENEAFSLGNDADATSSYDQFSPYLYFKGKGWKSSDSTSKYLCWSMYLSAAAGSANPVGSLIFKYGVDTTEPATELMRLSSNGYVGIGTTSPTATLSLGGSANAISLTEDTSTPAGTPASGSECKIYMKADKIVIQYNDGGTIRYKYMSLSGTGVTWTHSTTAP